MKDDFVNKDEGIARTSTSLLIRAKLEEHKAWEKVVTLYSPMIYKWCRGFGLDRDEAQAAGQEVFVSLFQKLGNFEKKKEEASFRRWLRKITKNKCLDFIRLKQKEAEARGGTNAHKFMQQIAMYEREKDDENSLRRNEKTILYRRAMTMIEGEFSGRDWMIFIRVVIEGRDPQHVAEEVETSIDNVYVVKSRVLNRLQEEFADLIDD